MADALKAVVADSADAAEPEKPKKRSRGAAGTCHLQPGGLPLVREYARIE